MYTLKLKNKTVSLIHNERHYVIGFKKAIEARKVHYNMHPDCKFTLIRDAKMYLKEDFDKQDIDLTLSLDVNATLFIPKFKGDFINPMNDAGFHLHEEDDFYALPVTKNLGIIVPYDLMEESEEEFIFKATVVDPKI